MNETEDRPLLHFVGGPLCGVILQANTDMPQFDGFKYGCGILHTNVGPQWVALPGTAPLNAPIAYYEIDIRRPHHYKFKKMLTAAQSDLL